jgi:hypothetical protein
MFSCIVSRLCPPPSSSLHYALLYPLQTVPPVPVFQAQCVIQSYEIQDVYTGWILSDAFYDTTSSLIEANVQYGENVSRLLVC